MIAVFGSHGLIQAHPDGTVAEYTKGGDSLEPEDVGYSNIARFDVEEWQRRYPGQKIEDATLDVLDIGYWTKDGQYEAPEDDWRGLMAGGAS